MEVLGRINYERNIKIPNPETAVMESKQKEWFEKYHDSTGSRRDNWVAFEEYILMDKK